MAHFLNGVNEMPTREYDPWVHHIIVLADRLYECFFVVFAFPLHKRLPTVETKLFSEKYF